MRAVCYDIILISWGSRSWAAVVVGWVQVHGLKAKDRKSRDEIESMHVPEANRAASAGYMSFDSRGPIPFHPILIHVQCADSC